MGNFPTVGDAYVLELGDLDFILGASWMQSFGKVTIDWDELKWSFTWQGEIREIQGVECRSEWDKKTRKTGHQRSSLYGLLWEDESERAGENDSDLDQWQHRELE